MSALEKIRGGILIPNQEQTERVRGLLDHPAVASRLATRIITEQEVTDIQTGRPAWNANKLDFLVTDNDSLATLSPETLLKFSDSLKLVIVHFFLKAGQDASSMTLQGGLLDWLSNTPISVRDFVDSPDKPATRFGVARLLSEHFEL